MVKNRGFTLIELIIVVAIIGLLAAALFVAVDPAKRIGQANDAQRWSEVTAVLNAILNYTADVQTLPAAISGMTAGTYYALNGTIADCDAIDDRTNIAEYTTTLRSNIVPTYIATIPTDPQASASVADYYIFKDSANRITVGSCRASSNISGFPTTASLEVTR